MDVARSLLDARARTLALTADLDDAQWLGARLPIVNPLLWEIAHVGWFQERWVLRHAAGRAPLVPSADALYDSARVAHDTRWDLPLLPRAEALDYLARVLERALCVPPGYFHLLALFHEDMHGEAFAYTRRTLGYPEPRLDVPLVRPAPAGPCPGDVEVPGGRFSLGATRDEPFVFDNEKWAHDVEVAPFRIARAPVTNAEFAAFVASGGYRDRRLWSDAGWASREAARAEMPFHWRSDAAGKLRERRYDRDATLAPHEPVLHVSWYEAEAYCRFAGRRLPTEAEWELAASGFEKRRFPWGDEAPSDRRANLDGRAGGPVDVGAYPEGDSPFGCRQMIGNAWEWTASDFAPYPGFVVDPYKEYSEPWFHSPHKVLRGGAWITRGRLLRNTWRNFYPPHRRDVFAGFRTCARAG
ncbi:MAG TPA: selenoneine synthase SenA [Minicystis sp.]|nr:selenoneine synthase SenA [Minicystis sp.]